ncbi:GFA family protein [Phenylobacterium sp.]|uniref:GFA family protein n=1 Tax=Phenylobacterium sp. TaxID=1871053 RepID=UPI002810ADD1|nr:GFA family protein [Phenylobacterium sp.]
MVSVERAAACVCGQLRTTLRGEPRRVYACHCLECQATTGSAMAHRAIFPDAAVVERSGEVRRWRRTGSSGGWLEQAFCPTCGTVVWMTAQALTAAISVSVGCFRDPAFPPPVAAHWTVRRPPWLRLAGVADAS